MELILFPEALLHLTVSFSHFTLTIFLPICPLSNVYVFVYPSKDSMAVSFSVLQVAYVLISCNVSKPAVAINFAINISTFIYPPISPFVSSLPTKFAVYVISYEVISTLMPELTLSLPSATIVIMTFRLILRNLAINIHWLRSIKKLSHGYPRWNLFQATLQFKAALAFVKEFCQILTHSECEGRAELRFPFAYLCCISQNSCSTKDLISTDLVLSAIMFIFPFFVTDTRKNSFVTLLAITVKKSPNQVAWVS